MKSERMTDDCIDKQVIAICGGTGLPEDKVREAIEVLRQAFIDATEAFGAILGSLIEYGEDLADFAAACEDAIFIDPPVPPLRPHPKIFGCPAELRPRTLRELYGQGVDMGPGRPSWADPPS